MTCGHRKKRPRAFVTDGPCILPAGHKGRHEYTFDAERAERLQRIATWMPASPEFLPEEAVRRFLQAPEIGDLLRTPFDPPG
jgi:hypothetical protein